MKRLPLLVLMLAVLAVAACRFMPGVAPSAATPTTAVTAAAPATQPPPTSAPAKPGDAPPATPDESARSVGDPAPGAAPIFDVDPVDRAVFAAGLTAAGQGALGGLGGAPVYHMAITIDDSMSRVVGQQTLFYTNLEDVALTEIYFHLHPNTLNGRITVSDVVVDGAPVEPAVEGDVLRVPLPAALAPGDAAVLNMAFQTDVPREIGRNYGVLAYYDDILALAHFYPMVSVYDDEGWNVAAPDIQGDLTYSDAGFYLVRVTAPGDVVLVASGSILNTSNDGSTQIVEYAAGPTRDFYLAAGEFIEVSRDVGDTIIRSYAPAELSDGAALALDVAAAALAEHNERLGPYPYSELDIVTTPTSALGIEYPGLIVGTTNMYDVGAQTAAGVSYAAVLESTTAHEVAHQWFYNLVGNDQLDEPWLDESVVSYSTYRYYVSRYGQDAGDAYFQTFYGRWNGVGREAIPVGLPVAAYDGVEYGAIVYGRGTIFVRELEETLGRETFDAFLRDYVARFAWEEATTADFRALAETHCGCDLEPLFAEWVYE